MSFFGHTGIGFLSQKPKLTVRNEDQTGILMAQTIWFGMPLAYRGSSPQQWFLVWLFFFFFFRLATMKSLGHVD
jgi:hypothetical protein